MRGNVHHFAKAFKEASCAGQRRIRTRSHRGMPAGAVAIPQEPSRLPSLGSPWQVLLHVARRKRSLLVDLGVNRAQARRDAIDEMAGERNQLSLPPFLK